MSLILKIALIASLFAAVSCQNKEEPIRRSDTLNIGFSLMDQGKYDEAITYFAELAEKDPHPYVKQAWASVYAAKAGLSFSKLVAFASIPVDENAVPTANTLLHVDRRAAELLEVLQRYEKHWNKVPSVNAEQNQDLQKSLDILSKETTPGTRIYSATLRIVLLKSSIEQGVQQWEAMNLQRVCTDQLKPYVNWAGDVLESVRLIIQDLEYAFPKNKKAYQDLQEQVRKAKVQAQTMTWPKERQCF